ncbi:unnamed protein product [Prorocentrum cordatum]|uniref:Uncharacterized protein n=1 Tax=Prorocentrum cordatum TaxID=2364126 RepID=A0ABN9TKJ4_9DINO|nr:unnamed protein product [Polarella glacialis]
MTRPPGRRRRAPRGPLSAAGAAGCLCLAARGLLSGFVPPPRAAPDRTLPAAPPAALVAANFRRVGRPEEDLERWPALAAALGGPRLGAAPGASALVSPGEDPVVNRDLQARLPYE